MKRFKTDPIAAGLGALMLVGTWGLVATVPTVAQPPVGQDGGTANGPPHGPPHGPPGGERKAVGPMLGHILHELNLTEKQKNQIDGLMNGERAQMEKIHQQMRQIHQKTRTELNALLTAEQRAQLEAQEKEMCQHGPAGEPGGPHRPPGPPPSGYQPDDF